MGVIDRRLFRLEKISALGERFQPALLAVVALAESTWSVLSSGSPPPETIFELEHALATQPPQEGLDSRFVENWLGGVLTCPCSEVEEAQLETHRMNADWIAGIQLSDPSALRKTPIFIPVDRRSAISDQRFCRAQGGV